MKRSVLVLLFVMLAAPVEAQSAEDLFQQALRVERVASNPAAAIELYQQIVDLPDAGRELVARAWLQMGKAYEVLGEERAVGAYSRVVRDFSDMREIAGEASERMAGLAGPVAKAETEPGVYPYLLPFRTRGNSMGSGMYGAAPSNSGNLIARENADWGITIDDLASGTTRDLSPNDLGCENGAYTMRFSPDDSKIAFACWGGRDVQGSHHLRLLDLSSGASTIVTTGPEFLGLPGDKRYEIEVYDWTMDGRYILASIQGGCDRGFRCPEKKDHVALVPLGSDPPIIIDPEYIREDRNFRETNACLMNDDSVMIAEYGPWDTDDGRVDVRITDIASQTERVLLGEEGVDYELFGCAKEESVVYYSRKRFESMMLRAADLTGDGELVNHRDIRPIKADTDAIMSHNGDVYYTETESWEQGILEVEIDPGTGSISGEVEKIIDGFGRVNQYTVDGNLAMQTKLGAFLKKPDGTLISIQGTGSGGFATDLAGPDLWVPRNLGNHANPLHYIVDGATGVIKDSVVAHRISPDHRTLYVSQDPDGFPSRSQCIESVSRDTGDHTELFCIQPWFGWLQVDPFSGRIIFQDRDQETEEHTVWLVDPETGEKDAIAEGNYSLRWAGGKVYMRGQETDFRRYDPETGQTESLATLEDLAPDASPVWGWWAVSQDETRFATQAFLTRASMDVELTVIRDPLGLDR